ncbi:hypothetical protein B0J13DRAFT_609028 [Dactylonectria estremocensis]|uniref:Uncharacterized protein n=1 Tax=Dactylonectria estremocensis TaxID=1079267 RepID=A0A9P9EMN2_9HYPO|nr:hypothetical protein B0J13DRAFT_609028 [Dactylonectria estremocensis]
MTKGCGMPVGESNTDEELGCDDDHCGPVQLAPKQASPVCIPPSVYKPSRGVFRARAEGTESTKEGPVWRPLGKFVSLLSCPIMHSDSWGSSVMDPIGVDGEDQKISFVVEETSNMLFNSRNGNVRLSGVPAVLGGAFALLSMLGGRSNDAEIRAANQRIEAATRWETKPRKQLNRVGKRKQQRRSVLARLWRAKKGSERLGKKPMNELRLLRRKRKRSTESSTSSKNFSAWGYYFNQRLFAYDKLILVHTSTLSEVCASSPSWRLLLLTFLWEQLDLNLLKIDKYRNQECIVVRTKADDHVRNCKRRNIHATVEDARADFIHQVRQDTEVKNASMSSVDALRPDYTDYIISEMGLVQFINGTGMSEDLCE